MAQITNKVRAEHAANSIHTYGEALFDQVFGNRRLYANYEKILQSGLSDLLIEVAGSPLFHALHWEAIRDPETQQCLALQATILRKNIQPQNLALSAQPLPTINLLIVTARLRIRRATTTSFILMYLALSCPMSNYNDANRPTALFLHSVMLDKTYSPTRATKPSSHSKASKLRTKPISSRLRNWRVC
jgi:hypothetical protein